MRSLRNCQYYVKIRPSRHKITKPKYIADSGFANIYSSVFRPNSITFRPRAKFRLQKAERMSVICEILSCLSFSLLLVLAKDENHDIR